MYSVKVLSGMETVPVRFGIFMLFILFLCLGLDVFSECCGSLVSSCF